MIKGSVIAAQILYNNRDEEFEEDFSDPDYEPRPRATHRYIGTGSNLVSPTMIYLDDYDTIEEEDEALAKAHEEDMAKVYDATVEYRKKLIKELEEVDKYLKEKSK